MTEILKSDIWAEEITRDSGPLFSLINMYIFIIICKVFLSTKDTRTNVIVVVFTTYESIKWNIFRSLAPL